MWEGSIPRLVRGLVVIPRGGVGEYFVFVSRVIELLKVVYPRMRAAVSVRCHLPLRAGGLLSFALLGRWGLALRGLVVVLSPGLRDLGLRRCGGLLRCVGRGILRIWIWWLLPFPEESAIWRVSRGTQRRLERLPRSVCLGISICYADSAHYDLRRSFVRPHQIIGSLKRL